MFSGILLLFYFSNKYLKTFTFTQECKLNTLYNTVTKNTQKDQIMSMKKPAEKSQNYDTTTHHHNRFIALYPGPPGWAGASRELLDFMVQGKINTGRYIDRRAACHSIHTKQCPHPPSPPIFYRPDALPADQPTVSKHRRQWGSAFGLWRRR